MRSLFKALYNNLHWVLIVFLAAYTFIPFLSPILFEMGYSRSAWWIQTIYSFMCHQRPERSLFLFGEQLTYSISELSAYGYKEAHRGYPFAGNSILGYKVAICVRDVFIYTSMVTAGAWVSISKKKKSIPWWALLGGSIPIALDGGIQFISEFFYLTQRQRGLDLANPWYLSNNGTRAVTGMIFGVTVGLFIFSELKAVLEDNI